MAVHMVRIYSEDPDKYTLEEVRTAVQDWVNSHTEWLADPVPHQIDRITDLDGNVYLQGDFRFDAQDDKTALLDDAESTIKSYVKWYRMGYHVCDHDEATRGGCTWDDSREHGPVPSHIPTFV